MDKNTHGWKEGWEYRREKSGRKQRAHVDCQVLLDGGWDCLE